jgi:hypothetical protein
MVLSFLSQVFVPPVGVRANDESWGSANLTVLRLSWAVHGLKKKDEEKGVFISQLLGAIRAENWSYMTPVHAQGWPFAAIGTLSPDYVAGLPDRQGRLLNILSG